MKFFNEIWFQFRCAKVATCSRHTHEWCAPWQHTGDATTYSLLAVLQIYKCLKRKTESISSVEVVLAFGVHCIMHLTEATMTLNKNDDDDDADDFPHCILYCRMPFNKIARDTRVEALKRCSSLLLVLQSRMHMYA